MLVLKFLYLITFFIILTGGFKKALSETWTNSKHFSKLPVISQQPHKKRKAPLERNEPVHRKSKPSELIEATVDSPQSHEPETLLNQDQPRGEPDMNSPSENPSDNPEVARQEIFHHLFDNKDSLKIPISWNRIQTTEGDFSAIKLTKVIAREVNNKMQIVSTKSIIISNHLKVEAQVMGVDLGLEKNNFKETNVSTA